MVSFMWLLYPRDRFPITCWIGNFVGPRAIADPAKRKISPLAWN